MHLFKIEKEWNSTTKRFPIIFLGDIHGGSPNCDYPLIQQHIEEISELPNASVFIMGDCMEWIVPGDRRFKSTNIDKRFSSHLEELPMVYLNYMENLLAPIADKIEVFHDGNHEKTMLPYMRPGAELCGRLRKRVEEEHGSEFAQNKLRYAPGEAYTKIIWKWNGKNSDRRSVMINTAHGWQAGRNPGAKHNSMAQVFAWVGAEVIMRGHSHELFAEFGSPYEEPNPQMTKIVEKTTIYGHTGSYLKTREVSEDSNYSEDAGYRPLPRGYIEIDIELNDKGLNKEIHIK